MGASVIGIHYDRRLTTAILAYGAWRGIYEGEKRYREIQRLPTVEWKGKTLYTIRCHGVTGKGPHDVNVPLPLLWVLIDLGTYRCVYHA